MGQEIGEVIINNKNLANNKIKNIFKANSKSSYWKRFKTFARKIKKRKKSF